MQREEVQRNGEGELGGFASNLVMRHFGNEKKVCFDKSQKVKICTQIHNLNYTNSKTQMQRAVKNSDLDKTQKLKL